MKKLIIGMGIAAMVMGMATMASATATDWYVNMKATSDTGAKAGQSNSKFGMKTNATSGDDSSLGYDATYTAAKDGSLPEIISTDLTNATTDNRWNVDQRTPYSGKGEVVWDLNMYAVTGFASSTIYLNAWNTTAGGLNAAGPAVTLYQVNDGTKVKLYTFDPAKLGTWSSSAGVGGAFFQQGFTYTANGLGSESNPYKFQLVAGTVPEPGSLVAMLSGLAGLVGFGIRRRK